MRSSRSWQQESDRQRKKLRRPRLTPDGVRRREWARPLEWRIRRLHPVQVAAFIDHEEQLREVDD